MKTWIYSILLICLTNLWQECRAQDSTAYAALIGRVDKENKQILLRWAPSNSQSWLLAIKHGYRLERYTVLKNKEMLALPSKTILNAHIMPKELADWEALADTNDYAAIIAEALYGEEFEISSNEGSIAQISAQSSQLEQRFSLSVYAAEHSFEAAQFAGWAYKDQAIHSDEKYLYRLLPLDAAGQALDSCAFYIGLADWEELPRPVGLAAVYTDHQVRLSWNSKLLNPFYHSYHIERSIDGSSFQALDGPAITDISADNGQDITYYIDTLANNKQTYSYRLRGINSFGEVGPPSDTVSGRGLPQLQHNPHILRVLPQQDASIILHWHIDSVAKSAIKHFEISQSHAEAQGYKILGQAAAQDSNYLVSNPAAGNYYKVIAIGHHGQQRSSFPYFYQAIDSIPPAPPTGLQASIDSLGIVQLSWSSNTEADLLGYRIYRAEDRDETPLLLQDSIYTQPYFQDSIAVNNLNPRVYYAVTALDQRFNASALSEILAVKKPDKIPPVSPVISGYRVDDDKIYIAFTASTSEDVVQHALLHKTNPDDPWKLRYRYSIQDLPQDSIQDSNPIPEQRNYYTLVAYDDSQNRSKIIQELAIDMPPKKVGKTGFAAYVDRDKELIELSWRKDTRFMEYQLYRAQDEDPPSLWKIIPADIIRLIDSELLQNSHYKYGIRPILLDGSMGQLEWLNVKY